MKKFLSIMMITLMIIVTVIGITACTKDEPDKEPDKLVGTWISVAEDNSHYPYDFNKTEEYRLYADYYAVITESENLFFKSYILFNYPVNIFLPSHIIGYTYYCVKNKFDKNYN